MAILVVLADNSQSWCPSNYGYELFGCRMGPDFPVAKILDWEKDLETLLTMETASSWSQPPTFRQDSWPPLLFPWPWFPDIKFVSIRGWFMDGPGLAPYNSADGCKMLLFGESTSLQGALGV